MVFAVPKATKNVKALLLLWDAIYWILKNGSCSIFSFELAEELLLLTLQELLVGLHSDCAKVDAQVVQRLLRLLSKQLTCRRLLARFLESCTWPVAEPVLLGGMQALCYFVGLRHKVQNLILVCFNFVQVALLAELKRGWHFLWHLVAQRLLRGQKGFKLVFRQLRQRLLALLVSVTHDLVHSEVLLAVLL